MEPARSSVNFCHTARRHIPEDDSLRSHSCDNLRSHCEAFAAVPRSFVQLCNVLGTEAGFYLIFLDCLTLKMVDVRSLETSVTAIRQGVNIPDYLNLRGDDFIVSSLPNIAVTAVYTTHLCCSHLCYSSLFPLFLQL